MSDSFETTIKNYSGLSSEIKPTIAVPNGSRWREVDTGAVFYFNLANNTWYQMDRFISGASPTVDTRALDIFEQILTTLKKIEYHLAMATDTNLGD